MGDEVTRSILPVREKETSDGPRSATEHSGPDFTTDGEHVDAVQLIKELENMFNGNDFNVST